VHYESRGAEQPIIVLSHECNRTLTHPLHNGREDIHYASMMMHAHGGVQHSASGHHYPMGVDQMSSRSNHEVNNDNDPRQMVMLSPNATHVQHGKLPLVDQHGRYAYAVPVSDSQTSFRDLSLDAGDERDRHIHPIAAPDGHGVMSRVSFKANHRHV
jgi:VCBS repeat-containing protein